MELAELNGKAWEATLEHGNDPFAPVDDKAGERMSCRKESIQGLFVMHDLLRDDFLPVEILGVGTAHEDAIAVSEECGIHGNDNGILPGLHLTRRSRVGIEMFPQRLRMLAVLPAQLRVCLLVRCIPVVGFHDPGILLETALRKLLPAIAAFVTLSAPALTVFLCAVKSTVYSAKLAFLKLEKDKSMISISL